MEKNIVLLINPPNSSTVLKNYSDDIGKPDEHSDWSDYPATGVLSLTSALKAVPHVEPVYIDGVVFPYQEILDFIASHKNDIKAIGISALTDTYEAGLKILEYSREINPEIVHIIGNDHFSSLPEFRFADMKVLPGRGFQRASKRH